MEIIILGLLMIHKTTIYEIKKQIKKTFTSVSSNSSGSIQSAIKKLLSKNMIVFTEYVENSVNKKVYEITDDGKEYFFTMLSKPMLYKEKNMELAKFFFMGFVADDKRIGLMDSYITELKTEKANLEKIRSNILDEEIAVSNYINYLESSGEIKKFEKMLGSKSVHKSVRDIAKFQIASLELSIAKVDFEIKWFEQFKRGM